MTSSCQSGKGTKKMIDNIHVHATCIFKINVINKTSPLHDKSEINNEK